MNPLKSLFIKSDTPPSPGTDERGSPPRKSDAAIHSLFHSTTSAASSTSTTSASSSGGLFETRSREQSPLDDGYTLPLKRARRPIRRNPNPRVQAIQWDKKSPLLAMGQFIINGLRLKVKKIGVGTFHSTFRFLDDIELSFNGTQVMTSELVLKTLNYGSVGPNKRIEITETDQAGYHHLKESHVPVTEIYVDPITFNDSQTPKNGMFWIVEKMDKAITGEEWKDCRSIEELDATSKKVLNFAKHWLTEMAKKNQDIINDFRKRNTMLKGDTIKIIDHGTPTDEKWEVSYMIGRYVVDWANGNRAVFDWLISDFPADMKPEFE